MTHIADDRNFRLTQNVRPSRYDMFVSMDLTAKDFRGDGAIALSLSADATELVLHASELELFNIRMETASGSVRADARYVAVSQTAILTFEKSLPRGDGVLRFDWKGRFNVGLRGLYLSGNVASTQFEAADARRLFPCFDEPAFKARWALRIEVPAELVALGNGRVTSEVKNGTRKTVTFEETDLLSSYLIALAVGPLAGTEEAIAGGVPVRTWALAEKKHLLAFGHEAALAALPKLSEYFGLPYAFGKVDQVGIPDFEAGAMENAGLITYREVALLLDPATAPLSLKKRVSEVVTHELAHQWFGNWVTMVWWDDLWLNEAFATWMATKIVDGLRPGWRVWLDFDAGKAAALHLDALKSTHPIRGVVRNADEAGEAFDVITYEKGGAVLRMIESFLGEDGFREGIRLYMKRHARANAVADDLWKALGEASRQPVVELANAWIQQSGFPVVSVTLNARTVSLRQQRFYSEPGVSSAERWPVPMVVRFEDDTGVHEQRLLLRDATMDVPLEGKGTVRWVNANAGSTGFYRVAYDEGSMHALTANLAKLQPSERVGLLADRWALVRADKASIASFLDLASKYGAEEDDAVLDELVGRLGYVESRLTEGAARLEFQGFVANLLGAQFASLGWEAKPNEEDGTKLRRASILRALGLVARKSDVVTGAGTRIQALLGKTQGSPLEPNLLDPSVAAAARHGDAALFDAFLAAFPNEPDPATKRRYLIALTAFEHPELIARAHKLPFEGVVPMGEISAFVGGMLGNREGRAAAWTLLRKEWTSIVEKTGRAPMILRRLVESLANLVDATQFEEAKTFLAAHPLHEVEQGVQQTLEKLSQDSALRTRVLPEVAAWLKARKA